MKGCKMLKITHRTNPLINLLAILLIAVFFVFLFPGCNTKGESDTKQSTVYDRVIKSGKLRAAYITYPPALMKDTKTGKMSGIFVEALEKAAENMGLKVEWTEEVGWGSQIEGLQTDRYDIVGSPVWANPTRGKLTTLSVPIYFSGIGIYVRSNEKRFVGDWTKINSSEVKIGTIDGETGDLIARTDFPEAKRVSLPQLSDISQLLLEIVNKKSDLAFVEPYFAFEFLKTNKGTLKNIASDHPIRVLGNVYMMKKDEFQLKQALDIALQDLLNSGYIDKLVDKYEPEKGLFYRVAIPYRVAK